MIIGKLGKKKYIFPLIIIIMIGLVMSCMFYPMANMSMQNLPFAIVSEDEGVVTSEGKVVVGDAVVNLMTSDKKSGDDTGNVATDTIKWVKLDSREEAEKAMKDNEYYGYIIIPADYSKKQYATIKDTLKEQIKKIKDQMSSGMDTSAMKEKMAGSSQASQSALKKKMASSVKKQVKKTVNSSQNLVQDGAKNAMLQKQLDGLVNEGETAGAAYAQAVEDYDSYVEGKRSEDPNYNPDEDTSSEMVALKDKVTTTKAKVDELTSKIAATKAAMLAAKGQTATDVQENVSNVPQTAQITASLLSAQFKNTMSALSSNIQSALSSMTNTDSGEADKMIEEKAGEAMVTAVDTINDKANGIETDEEDTSKGAKLEIYIDSAKSPMVANALNSAMNLMVAKSGMNADIDTINDGYLEKKDDDNSSSNILGAVMAQNLTIMPAIMLSLILGIIISRIFNMNEVDTRRERLLILVKQLVYGAVISGLIGLTLFTMIRYAGGIDVPFSAIFMYFWIASYLLMLISIGLGNIKFVLAVVFAVTTIAMGMSLGILPVEVVPEFWANYIAPWAPQKMFGEGLRSVIYMKEECWNTGTARLIWYAVTGIVIGVIGAMLPRKTVAGNKEEVAENKEEIVAENKEEAAE